MTSISSVPAPSSGGHTHCSFRGLQPVPWKCHPAAIQWTISSAQAHHARLDRCRAPRPARPLAAPGRIAPTGPPAARLESAQFFTISTAKRPPLGVWPWLNPIGCFGIAEGADRGRRLRRATGVCKPSAGERHVSQQRVASEANMKGDLAHLDATENRRSEERAILSHELFARDLRWGGRALRWAPDSGRQAVVKIENILFAMDFSEDSGYALTYA